MQAKLLEDSQSKDLIEARPQDGFGTSGQPDGALISWPYAPKNSFFYDQPAVPYTDRELADQVQVRPSQLRMCFEHLMVFISIKTSSSCFGPGFSRISPKKSIQQIGM